MAKRAPLTAIELDASIQCRASIAVGTVNDYAERMSAGDEFPAVTLFGDSRKCWIGDGWHRVLAAQQTGAKSIAADLRRGTRADALKFALGANAVHGQRRTNEDKRRCVEIALREFPKLSSRAVAKLCGVSPDLVDRVRPEQVPVSGTSTPRTGLDGKRYPARREPSAREIVEGWGGGDASGAGADVPAIREVGGPFTAPSPAPVSLASLRRIVGTRTTSSDRDYVSEIETLAARLNVTVSAYMKAGVDPADDERLGELWRLGAGIDSLRGTIKEAS